MTLPSLTQTLMRRDAQISAAAYELNKLLAAGKQPDATDFMAAWFSLEPDFILDILYHNP